MVREIYKDQFFLSQKCVPATPGDLPVATDLLDTLQAHQAGCVGMAANMIGVQKRIIAFDCEGTYRLMLNPVIIKKSGSYEAEEGCLSLAGNPQNQTLEIDQSPVSKRAISDSLANVHRLDGADHST